MLVFVFALIIAAVVLITYQVVSRYTITPTPMPDFGSSAIIGKVAQGKPVDEMTVPESEQDDEIDQVGLIKHMNTLDFDQSIEVLTAIMDCVHEGEGGVTRKYVSTHFYKVFRAFERRVEECAFYSID